MKKNLRFLNLLLTGGFLTLISLSTAQAAPTLVSPSPNSFGEIERITLNDPADVYSGGVMVVGGVEMILPKNLLIDLPANRLSLQQIFDQAPAGCKALGESGLAKADKCNGTGSGGIATLSAVRTNAGNVIVGDLFIQKAAESVTGVVTYVNYDQGYYRVNGLPNDPNTGAMVRLNDPGSRHTIQSGAGCAGGPNCSPDPRFGLDPDNYTNTFTTGYPMCIPSTVARPFPGLAGVPAGTAQAAADGTGDLLCPDTNRSAQLVEPPVADSRRFAPVKVGDSVLAEGNYETVGGVRFLSAHSSTVQKALSTQNVAGQPDYLFLEEVGLEAPPYQNQRLITLLIGFTTLANPATDVDVWSIHRDPVNNEIHEFPLASVQGCDNAAGAGTCSNQGLVGAGANIFKIRHDVDFLTGPDPKLSPCAHLLVSRFATSHPGLCSGAATTARDIAVLSPSPHEIIARTGKKITSPAGSLVTIDINGNEATNGEYLFPLGLNLGGLGVAEMSEVNINELSTPVPFEGIPWNLDRRLGPSGCLNGAGCEAGAVGSAAFALDPFPYSGLEPRLQATGLPNVTYTDPIFNSGGATLTSSRNRMFSYVTANGAFNGDSTLLPYVFGTFPADPPLIPIAATPALNLFPPVAVGDSATAGVGIPVVIDVLANDVAVVGTIDPTTVQIASGPASGTVAVNPTTGAITYTPTNPLITDATFTYTVANNFGSRSLPGTVTVTITIISLPVAPTPISPTGSRVSTTPTYTFTAIPGALFYAISLWDNTLATNVTTSYTAAQANCSPVTGICTVPQATPLVTGHSYSWFVFAQNAAGIGPWSASANFDVEGLPPAPIAVNPTGSVINPTPTYTFSAIPGATAYAISLWDNTLATNIITSYTPAQANCPSGAGTCTVAQATPLVTGHSYSWFVLAQNAVGIGPWSLMTTFNIEGLPPAPTPVIPTGSGITATPTYTFSAIPGATAYAISLWDNTLATNVYTAYTPAQANCPTGTGICTVAQATPLETGHSYSWFVLAQTVVGIGPWSADTAFVVQ